MTLFQEYGGTMIFQPSNPNDRIHFFFLSLLILGCIPIAIRPTDRILSICHEGWNRSQLLAQVLLSIQRCFLLDGSDSREYPSIVILLGFQFVSHF